jgi:hypothetical protein
VDDCVAQILAGCDEMFEQGKLRELPLHPTSTSREQLPTVSMSQAVASALTLKELLAPLPALASFGTDGVGGSAAQRSSSAIPPPAKRPRRAPSHSVATPSATEPQPQANETRIPASIAAAIDAVRRSGAPADTLFFASVPQLLSSDAVFRAAIATPLRDLKILRPSSLKQDAKILAWASFFNEADCVAALVSLRKAHPELNPRLHKPKAGGGTAGPAASASSGLSSRDAFESRASKIAADGGQVNTVMLRGLPFEVSCDEVTEVVSASAARPLRVRTAEGKSGKVRNFWMTYASRADACDAFVAISGTQAAFRCGRTMRLAPIVHNDATDAEGKSRIARDAALGAQGHAPMHVACPQAQVQSDGVRRYRVDSQPINADENGLTKLEALLREHGQLYFMDAFPNYP